MFLITGVKIGFQTTSISVNEDGCSVSVCVSVLEPDNATAIPDEEYRVWLTTNSSSGISGKRYCPPEQCSSKKPHKESPL